MMLKGLSSFLVLVTLSAACASSRSSSGTVLATTGGGLHAAEGAYHMEVLVDGIPAQSYVQRGETWILGERGRRYTLRISNRSARRVEAVVSVDGLDVVDGHPADWRTKRGYLVPSWGSVDIEGWRTSPDEVAAFRFASVAESYAAQTGSSREVGVIGAAIFPEREAPPRPPRPALIGEPRPVPYEESPSAESAAAGASRPAPPPAGSPSVQKSAPRSADSESSRPGLGTEFGEAVSSRVEETELVRAEPDRPAAVLGVRYNDWNGLVAAGVVSEDREQDRRDDTYLRRTATPFPE